MAMNDKYNGSTPGPWRIVTSKKPKHAGIPFILDAEGNFIGKVYCHTGLNADINAELIADAPMLAERVNTLETTLKTANDCLIIIKPAHDKLAEQNSKILTAIKHLVHCHENHTVKHSDGPHQNITELAHSAAKDLIAEIEEESK